MTEPGKAHRSARMVAALSAAGPGRPHQPHQPNHPDQPHHDGRGDGVGLVLERTKVKPKKPPLYKVLLLNDDYTPMEFVVLLLMKFFSMNESQAEQVMLHVHTRGVGVCGLYPREIAETKVRMVLDFAGEKQYPLQCTLERE